MLKNLVFFIFYFSFCLFFNLEAQEKLFFKLDGRLWKIGFENKNENELIIELILEDENILDWSELFTIQAFSGLNTSASEFSSILEKLYKEKVTENVENRIHFEKKGDQSLNIIENSFVNENSSNTLNNQEFNIGRILKGKDKIYYIRYSAKSEEIFKANSERWQKKLSEAYVSDEKVKEKKGHWFIFTNDKLFEGHNPLTYKPTIGTITDEMAGFTLSLPFDWLIDNNWKQTLSNESHRKETIALLFTNPSQSILGGISFFNINEKDKALKFNPRNEYILNKKKENEDFKLLEKGKLQTNLGNQSFYLILEEKNDIGWIHFFYSKNRIYRVEFWTSANNFEKARKDIEEIIKNFNL